MRRELAHFGGTGRPERPVRSIACLAFVAALGAAGLFLESIGGGETGGGLAPSSSLVIVPVAETWAPSVVPIGL